MKVFWGSFFHYTRGESSAKFKETIIANENDMLDEIDDRNVVSADDDNLEELTEDYHPL